MVIFFQFEYPQWKFTIQKFDKSIFFKNEKNKGAFKKLRYDIDQPTMINVIREPIDWFSSHYHFKLYGWSRKPGQRGDQNEMTLEECINTNAPTCARNHCDG